MVFNNNHFFPLSIPETTWNTVLKNIESYCETIYLLLEEQYSLLKGVVLDAALEKEIWTYRINEFPKKDNIFYLGSGESMLAMPEFKSQNTLIIHKRKDDGKGTTASNKKKNLNAKVNNLQDMLKTTVQFITNAKTLADNDLQEVINMLENAQTQCTVLVDLTEEEEEEEGIKLCLLFCSN